MVLIVIMKIILVKRVFQERILWLENNLEKINNLDIEFILKAESPFLFSSFCLTMRDYYKHNKDIVYLPVFLDATCNGIQQVQGLIEDLEIGTKVNLIPQNKEDKVEDIYSELIEPINTGINNYD